MNLFKNVTIALVLTVFALTACDNPSGHDHDHADAVGFVILQNNAEILRFENNQFNYNKDGAWDEYFSEVDGETVFTLSPAVIPDMSRGMTPSVTIRWIDGDGDLFDLEEEADGGEYRLEWTWGMDLGERPANIEQHGSDGSWSFHFRADHVGDDVITFRLDHGDHSDFVASPMPVYVADGEGVEDGVYPHERDRSRER